MNQYELTGAGKDFSRGSATIHAVDAVDLVIEAGEFVALEGPSGSGKTTKGRDLAELRVRSFGFVFQQFNLIPTLTALENIEAKLAPAGLSAAESRGRAETVLAEVGLADRATHLPGQLSGGEQRAAVSASRP